MSRLMILSLAALLGIALLAPPRALAKKAHPATTTAPTTQPSSKDKSKDKDDEDDGDARETHKKRAAEIAKGGKELDKNETQAKLDKLTGQVNALDKKLKDKDKEASSKKDAPTTKKGSKGGDSNDEEEAPSAKRRKGRTPPPPADEDEEKDERAAKSKK